MLLLTKNNSTETNFAKAILPEEVVNNTKVIPLIEHSASTIKVVFESNSDVQELKDKFLQNLDSDDFSVVSPDFSGLLDWYAERRQILCP